jgi:hypothetical protein
MGKSVIDSLRLFFFKRISLKYSAWLTAAVDNNERIIGAIPIVMDILNFRAVRSKSDHLLFF